MATKVALQSLKGKEKALQEEIDKFRAMQKGEGWTEWQTGRRS